MASPRTSTGAYTLDPRQDCVNCQEIFRPVQYKSGDKIRSYGRYSVERNIPRSTIKAREVYERVTSLPLKPVNIGTPRANCQFLCAKCWNHLCGVYRYQAHVDAILGCMKYTGYVGRKRPSGEQEQIVAKQPKTEPEDSDDLQDSVPQDTSTLLPEELQEPDSVTEDTSTVFPEVSQTASQQVFLPTKVTLKDRLKQGFRSLSSRHNLRGLRQLYSLSPSMQRAFHQHVVNVVRKEVKDIMTTENFSLCMDATLPNISNFSWDKTLREVQSGAPLLYAVLTAVPTGKKNAVSLNRASLDLKPYIGHAISVLLYAHSRRQAAFVQKVTSVQMWWSKMKKDTLLQQLSRFGICLGDVGTVHTIDQFRKHFDKAALEARHLLEDQLKEIDIKTEEVEADNTELGSPGSTDDVPTEADAEADTESDQKSSDVSSCSDSEDEETEDDDSDEDGSLTSEEARRHPGFTLTWNNVSKQIIPRHPSDECENTDANFALGYMAMNRVPSTHLNNSFTNLKEASSMPVDTFIPSINDSAKLRCRMEVIVARIIARHIPYFQKHFSDCTVPHVIHQHFRQSTTKSVMVNLGVFQHNPNSTEGAIGIYDDLMKYVPDCKELPYPTLVFGDALGCEHGHDAKTARANELGLRECLEGLEPAPQEFHKEMLLLQDYYNVFYDKKSVTESGTLAHARKAFNYGQAKSNVSESFSYSWDLMRLVTEAYVCSVAAHMLGMSSLADNPRNAVDGIEDEDESVRTTYMKGVVQDIVAAVWHTTDTALLRQHPGTDSAAASCCHEEHNYGLVECPMRDKSCSTGLVTNTRSYRFCLCGIDRGVNVPMIGCSAGSKCCHKEWYHYTCVSLKVDQIPKGTWFCSPECNQRTTRKKTVPPPQPDHICLYAKAMTWRGLNLLCRRDAVREADGEAMMSYWKFDLIHFFARQHPKYLSLAHRLVASLAGWLPEKLVQDLTWNRTVNYSGGIGRNLPADLMNEMLNRSFKELLTTGLYTDNMIEKWTQIVGPLGEAIDKMYSETVVENVVYQSTRPQAVWDTNVADLIEMYWSGDFLSITSGRQYRSFPKFSYTETPSDPEKFTDEMTQLSQHLDQSRRHTTNS